MVGTSDSLSRKKRRLWNNVQMPFLKASPWVLEYVPPVQRLHVAALTAPVQELHSKVLQRKRSLKIVKPYRLNLKTLLLRTEHTWKSLQHLEKSQGYTRCIKTYSGQKRNHCYPDHLSKLQQNKKHTYRKLLLLKTRRCKMWNSSIFFHTILRKSEADTVFLQSSRHLSGKNKCLRHIRYMQKSRLLLWPKLISILQKKA